MSEENKTIVAVLDIPGQTDDQQDQLNKELEEAGAGSPEGRLYHVGCSKEGGIFVVEVWESDELRDQFVQKLVPILRKLGLPPAEPQIYPVRNIIKG